MAAGDYDGRTCLHLAACEQQLGVIHFLMYCHTNKDLPFAKKVELNPVDNMGGTPLEDAVRHGHQVVEMLLRQHGGVCSDDPKAMEEARRRQAQANAERRNRSVEKEVAALVARSSEARTAGRMETYLQQLVEINSSLQGEVESVIREVGELAAMEQEYNSNLLRPNIVQIARRQVFLEATHGKLHALVNTFLTWAAALENFPCITPPVLHRLIMGPAEESNTGKAGKGIKWDVKDLDGGKACLERLQLLTAVVSCTVSMLDGSAGGDLSDP